jgi:hypothetical protein
MEYLLFFAVLAGKVPAEAPRDNGIIAVRAAVAPIAANIERTMCDLLKNCGVR